MKSGPDDQEVNSSPASMKKDKGKLEKAQEDREEFQKEEAEEIEQLPEIEEEADSLNDSQEERKAGGKQKDRTQVEQPKENDYLKQKQEEINEEMIKEDQKLEEIKNLRDKIDVIFLLLGQNVSFIAFLK